MEVGNDQQVFKMWSVNPEFNQEQNIHPFVAYLTRKQLASCKHTTDCPIAMPEDKQT